jgi:hypothetical protein
VDQALPSLDVVRPWRTATLIASAVAALELVVIVGAGVALLGRSVAHHVKAAAVKQVYAPVKKATATPVNAPAGKPGLPRSQTVVTVLNGGGISGAAASEAQTVRGLGYVLGPVGNAPHRAARTVVEYRAGYRAEAKRLAGDLQVKVISPLDGLKPRDLLGAQVALILGR